MTVAAADSSDDRSVAAQRLFHIERSKNANIVAYDVRLDGDGKPDSRAPVDVYWLGTDGSHYPLNGLQRRLAYGVKTRFHGPDVLVVNMVANVGREIRVERIGGVFRAVTDIAGKPAILDRMYVKSVERAFLLPSVEFVDLFGFDLDSGAERTERVLP